MTNKKNKKQLIGQIPVHANNITYKNVFCALCNLKKLPDNLIFWAVGFQCPAYNQQINTYLDLNSGYGNGQVINHNLESGTSLLSTSNTEELSKILPNCKWKVFPDEKVDFRRHMRPCVKYHGVDDYRSNLAVENREQGERRVNEKQQHVNGKRRDETELESNQLGLETSQASLLPPVDTCDFSFGEGTGEKLNEFGHSFEQKTVLEKGSYDDISSIGINENAKLTQRANINSNLGKTGGKFSGGSGGYKNTINTPKGIVGKLPPSLRQALSLACRYYQYTITVNSSVILTPDHLSNQPSQPPLIYHNDNSPPPHYYYQQDSAVANGRDTLTIPQTDVNIFNGKSGKESNEGKINRESVQKEDENKKGKVKDSKIHPNSILTAHFSSEEEQKTLESENRINNSPSSLSEKFNYENASNLRSQNDGGSGKRKTRSGSNSGNYYKHQNLKRTERANSEQTWAHLSKNNRQNIKEQQSKKRSNTFRNHHCALCNGVPISNLDCDLDLGSSLFHRK